ncbi:MAG: hypothetical protein KZQ93_12740 [Candidatus Thiodiazotropha sp. (ex Monitilora ramsayi)]|nr:hypothetical protein [Candidatus Thiodiazotropha sp. (ex Monitilora ramsayi)]
MEDRLRVELHLPQTDIGNEQSLERVIASLVIENQNSFHPLFERLIDTGDARITVMDRSVVVNDVSVSGNEGGVDIEFGSGFYASCKDMNSTGEHACFLEFQLNSTSIIFDMELPPAWKPDYY